MSQTVLAKLGVERSDIEDEINNSVRVGAQRLDCIEGEGKSDHAKLFLGIFQKRSRKRDPQILNADLATYDYLSETFERVRIRSASPS